LPVAFPGGKLMFFKKWAPEIILPTNAFAEYEDEDHICSFCQADDNCIGWQDIALLPTSESCALRVTSNQALLLIE
jgi:hypothetical protein